MLRGMLQAAEVKEDDEDYESPPDYIICTPQDARHGECCAQAIPVLQNGSGGYI